MKKVIYSNCGHCITETVDGHTFSSLKDARSWLMSENYYKHGLEIYRKSNDSKKEEKIKELQYYWAKSEAARKYIAKHTSNANQGRA